MIITITFIIFLIIIFDEQKNDQMSWYDRAKGRRKFRVNEEDLGHIQFQVFHITFYDDDDHDDDGVDDDVDDDNSNFRSC